ncbi:hypothetical protein OHU11_41875 (plasmid) [Streptomyces sp. NBC_00257]|uniref:hypothetical protein n=1 Tax=unclassified Streptomyces TaxID=2593676 RepID=UPI0022510155|nr:MULTISPECIES: hypothetical protein [unclassified Streptomyces]MCX5434731.1 hypothetical protein [Streptomyces sp. NBC_00062]
MQVTFDFSTAVWTIMGILVGVGVYQWSQPTLPTAPTAQPMGMTKGERLVLALTAAVAVITFGAYISHGVKKVEIDKPVPTVSTTISPTVPTTMPPTVFMTASELLK